jgi:hypothetical protein
MSLADGSPANATSGLLTSNASKHLRKYFDILKLPVVLHNPLIHRRLMRRVTSFWHVGLVLGSCACMSVNWPSV